MGKKYVIGPPCTGAMHDPDTGKVLYDYFSLDLIDPDTNKYFYSVRFPIIEGKQLDYENKEDKDNYPGLRNTAQDLYNRIVKKY